MTVNARDVGVLPLAEAIVVNAGNVDVELSLPGYRPMLRSITIAGGNYERLMLRLEPVNETGSSTTMPDQIAPAPPVLLSQPGADPHEDRAGRPVYKSPWFWVAAGTVVVAVGAVLVLSTGDKQAGPTLDGQGTYP